MKANTTLTRQNISPAGERKPVVSPAAGRIAEDWRINFYASSGRAKYFAPACMDSSRFPSIHTFAALLHAHERLGVPVVRYANETGSPVVILSDDGTLNDYAKPVLVFRLDTPADHPVIEWMVHNWSMLGPKADAAIFEAILAERKADFLANFSVLDAIEGYNHIWEWFSAHELIYDAKMSEIGLAGVDVESVLIADEYSFSVHIARDKVQSIYRQIRANLRRYAMQDRYVRKLAWKENWLNLLDVKPLEQPAIIQPVMQQAAGSDIMDCIDVEATAANVQTATIHQFAPVDGPKRPAIDEQAVNEINALCKAKGLDIDDIKLIMRGALSFFAAKQEEAAPKKSTPAKIHHLPAIEQAQAEKKEEKPDIIEQIKAELCLLGWESPHKEFLKKSYFGGYGGEINPLGLRMFNLYFPDGNQRGKIILQYGWENPLTWYMGTFRGLEPAKIAEIIDASVSKYADDTSATKKRPDPIAPKIEPETKKQEPEIITQIGKALKKLGWEDYIPLGYMCKKVMGYGRIDRFGFYSMELRFAPDSDNIALHYRKKTQIVWNIKDLDIMDAAQIATKIEDEVCKYVEKISTTKGKQGKAAENSVKVGDIFVSTWGYEQTNVNFYQVVKATPKTVMVREIRREKEDGGVWGNYQATPIKDAFCSEPMRRRLDHYSDRPSISISSYASARLWDGKPVDGTDYA